MLVAVIFALAFYMIEVNSTFMQRNTVQEAKLLREASGAPMSPEDLTGTSASSLLSPVMDAMRVRRRWRRLPSPPPAPHIRAFVWPKAGCSELMPTPRACATGHGRGATRPCS